MSKFNPRVKRAAQSYFLLANGVIGGGSGHGSPDVYPMSFSEWVSSGHAYDFDLDGTVDIWDLYYWWDAYGLPVDEWYRLNPGYNYPPF